MARQFLTVDKRLDVKYCLRVTTPKGKEIREAADADGEKNVVKFIRELIDIGLAVKKAQR